MEYAPLDVDSLSADAQRAMGSGAGRMMAARGMAPLANPVDLASVMYQLCQDESLKIREFAKKTAESLPLAILSGAVSDATLNPLVIDFFVHTAQCRSELLELVVLNPSTADETIAEIAAKANSKLVDIIAENQLRILRHSNIIASLYKNSNARMSTVDRVVELAVRHEMKVPGLPAWDEISRAVLQSEKEGEPKLSDAVMDAIFAKTAAKTENEALAPEEETDIRKMTTPMKLRLAMMGTKFQRSILVRDPKKMVALATIKSPAVKEIEAAKYAGNNSISEDVLGYIASKKEWTKRYHVKTALVMNPKCPLPAAMRLLPHLRIKEINAIARSRGVPSALSSQAKKLKMVRSRSGKKR